MFDLWGIQGAYPNAGIPREKKMPTIRQKVWRAMILINIVALYLDLLRFAALRRHLHQRRTIVWAEDDDAILAPAATDEATGIAKHLSVSAVQIRALELSVRAVSNRAAVRRPERFKRVLRTGQKFYFGGIEVADVEHALSVGGGCGKGDLLTVGRDDRRILLRVIEGELGRRNKIKPHRASVRRRSRREVQGCESNER